MSAYRRASLSNAHDAVTDDCAAAHRLRVVPAIFGPRHALTLLLTTAAMSGVGAGLAAGEPAKPSPPPAPAAQPSNEELLRNLQCMEQRIRALEGQLKSQAAASTGSTDVPAESTPAKTDPPPKPFPMRIVQVRDRDAKDKKPSTKNGTETAPSVAGPAVEPVPVPPSKPSVTPKPAADPCGPQPNAPSSTRTATSAAPSAAATPPAVQAPLLPPLPGAPATPGSKPILGLVDSPVPGLSIGAYGEIKFGSFQNPAANGQWQNGFDAHRLVLLPTYAITPNIIFNAEIEFEHGGIAFDPDDKLHGSVDIEQIFVDFLILDQLNWRTPGIDLIPIGYINQHHEPTQFYSVHRPELYNGLIPSTWRAPASSIYGTITEGIKYQLQVSSSLEDFGDDFGLRTEANTVPLFPVPYLPGIDGLTALAFSRPPVGDFRQLSNDLAYSGKLDFTPPFLPGLGWSVSAYYTPNTTPREAHDDFGNPLGRSSLIMLDAEFRYRIPNTPVELRGEYVHVTFGHPENLRANNDTDPTNNVGKTMFGYSGEVAFHVPLGTILSSQWEAVPFYRYTYQNFQTGGFAGTDLDMPTGAGQTHFYTTGVAVFPSPNIVLKATYQRVKNNDPFGARRDSILGGVGFFF